MSPKHLSFALTLLLFPFVGGCNCNSGTPAPAETGTRCDGICPVGTDSDCCNKPNDTLKPGIVGRFSALAASKGILMASAYESSFGDLLLASVKTDALDAPPTLEIVDGVPQEPPTKPTSTWRGGVESPGDDVGQDTDIAVGNNGEPMIVYHDVTHRSLKFAFRLNGKWTLHVVDQPKGDKEVVGRHSSMILLEGKPAVAYLVLNIPGTTAGTFNSELRWASSTSLAPGAAADWSRSVIDPAKPMSCQNLCAATEVCVPKSDGTSSCQAKTTGCPTCGTNEACVAGACTKILPEVKVVDIPKANGLWPAATRTTPGPVVVYYDRTAGRLLGAVLTAGVWKKKSLAGSGTEDVGAFPAATSSGNVVFVTFQDAARLTLKYLQLDASNLTATIPEIVDDGIRSNGPHPVGADSAILIDASGIVRVVYQDALTADLLAAKRTGTGQWTPPVNTDGAGRVIKGGPKAYGFYSDLVLEGGQVYGSTFFYDAQANPKGGLSFFKLP